MKRIFISEGKRGGSLGRAGEALTKGFFTRTGGPDRRSADAGKKRRRRNPPRVIPFPFFQPGDGHAVRTSKVVQRCKGFWFYYAGRRQRRAFRPFLGDQDRGFQVIAREPEGEFRYW